MSMLAETRRKTKWSLNPQGKQWCNDDNKVGQKLMEKMGWSKGSGLGLKENGMIDPITLKKKGDNKGIGFEGIDNTWLSHQEDFTEVLANLNEINTNGADQIVNVKSLEEISKKSKKRVHYKKFTQGKDLSRATDTDLNSILGTERIQFKKNTSEAQKISKEGNENNLHGVKTINGGCINEYFAQKMAALQKKRKYIKDQHELIETKNDQPEFELKNVDIIEETIADSISPKRKSKKRQENKLDNLELSTDSTKSSKKRKLIKVTEAVKSEFFEKLDGEIPSNLESKEIMKEISVDEIAESTDSTKKSKNVETLNILNTEKVLSAKLNKKKIKKATQAIDNSVNLEVEKLEETTMEKCTISEDSTNMTKTKKHGKKKKYKFEYGEKDEKNTDIGLEKSVDKLLTKKSKKEKNKKMKAEQECSSDVKTDLLSNTEIDNNDLKDKEFVKKKSKKEKFLKESKNKMLDIRNGIDKNKFKKKSNEKDMRKINGDNQSSKFVGNECNVSDGLKDLSKTVCVSKSNKVPKEPPPKVEPEPDEKIIQDKLLLLAGYSDVKDNETTEKNLKINWQQRRGNNNNFKAKFRQRNFKSKSFKNQ